MCSVPSQSVAHADVCICRRDDQIGRLMERKMKGNEVAGSVIQPEDFKYGCMVDFASHEEAEEALQTVCVACTCHDEAVMVGWAVDEYQTDKGEGAREPDDSADGTMYACLPCI